MINVRYADAMKEVLHYLRGIREEDINKIPKNFIEFLEKNASRDYDCDFDYTKPLKELDLLEESKGIIGLICYKYWCETDEQKQEFLRKLDDNEKEFQKELKKMYNVENIFDKKNKKRIKKSEYQSREMVLTDIKESKIKRIYNKFIMFIKKIKK